MVKKTFSLDGLLFSVTLIPKSAHLYQATIASIHGTKTVDIDLISYHSHTKTISALINQKRCFKAKVSYLQSGDFLINLLHQTASFLIQEKILSKNDSSILPARTIHQKTDDAACTLKSPLGGRVIKVNINEGDWVKENQALFVIESMKMENEICAPFNARVKTLSIAPGNVVQPSQVLITFERKGEGNAITQDKDQQKEIQNW